MDLHDEVQQDTKNGGHLQKLLTGYNLWLSTLSPFDQARIDGETDPVKRAQLVKTIREEQQKRQSLAAVDQPRRRAVVLTPKDLDVMLKAVEENFLTPESRKKIPGRLTGRDRHLRILKSALSQVRVPGNEGNEAAQALVSTLVDAAPNGNAKSRLLNAGRQPRRVLGQMLARSLAAEWQPEIEAVYPTKSAIDEEIAERLAAADPSKRDSQKTQLNSFQGRRTIGFQLAIQSGEQFKELRPVFFWLLAGLPHNPGAARTQPGLPRNERRGAVEKTKSTTD
jgi:hypothetical protein